MSLPTLCHQSYEDETEGMRGRHLDIWSSLRETGLEGGAKFFSLKLLHLRAIFKNSTQGPKAVKACKLLRCFHMTAEVTH